MFRKMNLLSLVLTGAVASAHAQSPLNGHFGWPEQPSDDTPVDGLIDYGQMNDMSGGYQLGETVADFTVYDFNGNSLTLSEKLTGPKPVILVSGSASCTRFRESFDLTFPGGDPVFMRNFMQQYQDDFEWIFIYGVEAHPSEGDCPSNCSLITTLDTAVVQHPDYHYRRYALRDWTETDMPYEFWFDMYADNPDNSIYNNFFQRPFGFILLTCDGRVAQRGDWASIYVAANSSTILAFKDGYEPCFTLPPVDEEDEEEEENSVSVDAFGQSMSECLIYPNPFAGELKYRSEFDTRIVIRDVMGRLLLETNVKQGAGTLPMNALNAGVYNITHMSANGLTITERFIKY
jgi:hypothetical protein